MTDNTKKSTQPSQPSALWDISEPTTQRKSTTIISRYRNRRKVILRRRIIMAAVAIILIIVLSLVVVVAAQKEKKEPGTEQEPAQTETQVQQDPEPEVIRVYFVAADADGTTAINMQQLSNAWAAEAGFEIRYELTDEERWEVASVLERETGGEIFAGKMAVAQCILQACEDDDIRPTEALKKYKYATERPDPSDESLLAVSAVFDFGWAVTSAPIKYFYAPELAEGEWHETQVYVCTIGGHKFFKEEGAKNGTIHGKGTDNDNERQDDD